MTFDKTDLLKQAGFSEGDYIPLASFGSDTANQSFSSTSYSTVEFVARFDYDLIPIDTLGISLLTVLTNDTAGETTFARLRDRTNNQPIPGTEVSATGTGFTAASSGIVEYTESGTVLFTTQGKVTGGTGIHQYDQHSQIAIIWGKLGE